MKKPNIEMTRVDERLIHGQGQLWIRSLGINLVICANDKVVNDPMQQSLMKTVISKDVDVRFWSVKHTAETVWKAAPRQKIFVIVKSTEDARKLCEYGYPMDILNIGNIHNAEDKEKISQFIYLGKDDKDNLKILRDKFDVKFNTKTSPVTTDGEKYIDSLMNSLN